MQCADSVVVSEIHRSRRQRRYLIRPRRWRNRGWPRTRGCGRRTRPPPPPPQPARTAPNIKTKISPRSARFFPSLMLIAIPACVALTRHRELQELSRHLLLQWRVRTSPTSAANSGVRTRHLRPGDTRRQWARTPTPEKRKCVVLVSGPRKHGAPSFSPAITSAADISTSLKMHRLSGLLRLGRQSDAPPLAFLCKPGAIP